MSDELLDKDPFGEEAEAEAVDENMITEGMVKKATYLIHKLAEQRKQDFKEIQKKCKKLFGYTNLAKVSLEDGHTLIDKLIELTGGEEKEQGAIVTDDLSEHKEIETEPGKKVETMTDLKNKNEGENTKELIAEIGKLAEMLQICVGFSRDIVMEEIGKNNITEGTQATMVKSFTATLFIEASKRGLGR